MNKDIITIDGIEFVPAIYITITGEIIDLGSMGYRVSKTGILINKHGKQLKPDTVNCKKDRYSDIRIIVNGVKKNLKLHRIVLSTFKTEEFNLETGKIYCDHIDNDRTNNDISNLRWLTQLENLARRTKVGRPKKVVESKQLSIFDNIEEYGYGYYCF